MSLVNDMLRDLEARRAAPTERERLDGMHAVDESAARRRERHARFRRWGLLATGALMLAVPVAWLVGGRLEAPEPPALVTPVVAVPSEPADAAVPVAGNRLLEVLPQNEGTRFVLQLLLERSVSYQRVDQQGFVSLRLPGVEMAGEPRSGRIEREGQSLSWRVEARGADVEVVLMGLGDRLDVRDRLEMAGDRWQLWLDVPLTGTPEASTEAELPVAEESAEAVPQLPEWVTRPAPVEQGASPAPRPMDEQAPAVKTEARPVEPRVAIDSHRPAPLEQARAALERGDLPQAITELEALHKARPKDGEVSRWLARAYLATNRSDRLLAWLPGVLQQHPQDSELRMLLARGQLQSGDQLGAITTLKGNLPPVQRDAAYHALLAALYQQVGEWGASADTYRRLVALRPPQATWQLGLAIALEQLDQPAQAARHYRLALQGQGLDADARRFATERAGALGGIR